MDMQTAINRVIEKHDLNSSEMEAVMRTIMTGEATQSQIGGFLVGIRMKGETVDEIAAAAKVMRDLATRIDVNADYLVDTCGTGGDARGTFNISTASAVVAATAGCHVAKHGNRSVSSKSGSADVLEEAGVNLGINPDQVARCINDVGVGFMFAPAHHSAMKHAIGPRREMGVRTIFNILGPLTNPAGAPNQVLGVFCSPLLRPLAEVLNQLGSRHVLVVHADDGLDEISISCPTDVCELKYGTISEYRIEPEQFGMQKASLDSLKVADAAESLGLIKVALGGEAGPAADIIALNAGAAIYASGKADSLAIGVKTAQEILSGGAALATLEKLVDTTKQMS